MRLAWVAVPVPALDLLTYLVPDSLDVPPIGARVLVPVGTRRMTGVVVRTDDVRPSDLRTFAVRQVHGALSPSKGGPSDSAALRPIIDLIDDEPFLPRHVVELTSWLAEYYACGPGEAVAAAMPPFAWIESERATQITAAGQEALQSSGVAVPGLDPAGVSILRALSRGEIVPVRVLTTRLSREVKTGARPAMSSVVRALERAGLVKTTTALQGRGSAFKTMPVATITVAGIELLAGDARSGRRQREALALLQGTADGMSLAALRDRGISGEAVRRLQARGLITVRQVRVERNPFAESAPKAGDQAMASGSVAVAVRPGNGDVAQALTAVARELTEEQAAALERLRALAARRTFAVALLHGVTGSGKTEVYLQLARDVLASSRSVLVLVPEIALTPALVALFRAAFGDRIAVQHSGLSDGERHDQWQRIRRGDIDLVVGTRSAVFAPLQRLGLVVVDEEHDSSYKQEETPRYHGRDVAIVRAKREGALAVLGSATPSMESYQHALTGRYEHLVMARRVLERPLADVRIIDMREEYARQGPEAIFSEALRTAIDQRLARREQVLVLLNRRGFATAILCRQCGNTVECPNCSVSLTIHGQHSRRARCHYCNYSTLAPKSCPACAAPYLEHVGIATERLEQEAATLFPGARVARLDRDVAARRGATASLLARFGAGDIDILIGTQMIAKGHDFPRITLVGVISADVGLGLPDFRASERTFQLLTQVVGRAGRGEMPGEAIIQTFFPGHYSVRLACAQDYPGFFAKEIEFRRSMRYPPHVSLVNAIVRAPTLQAAMEDASDLVRRVRAAADGAFRVLGPAPAALTRLRGEHRAQFFVKGTRRAAMRQAVQAAVGARPDLRRRITIDVDPLSVL
jgi:primosomal protein N' (replication factor Y)